jgi:hypothetical protein
MSVNLKLLRAVGAQKGRDVGVVGLFSGFERGQTCLVNCVKICTAIHKQSHKVEIHTVERRLVKRRVAIAVCGVYVGSLVQKECSNVHVTVMYCACQRCCSINGFGGMHVRAVFDEQFYNLEASFLNGAVQTEETLLFCSRVDVCSALKKEEDFCCPAVKGRENKRSEPFTVTAIHIGFALNKEPDQFPVFLARSE